MSIARATLLTKCPDGVPQTLTSLKALNPFVSSARLPSNSALYGLWNRANVGQGKQLHSRGIPDSWRGILHRNDSKSLLLNVVKCCNERIAGTDSSQSPSSDIVPEYPIRTLLVDNYDSYTYNLFQLLSVVNGVAPVVLKNDEITWDELYHLLYKERAFHNVVISPGPGSPTRASDIGICTRLLQECYDIPILGVCLGHQALGFVHGAQVLHGPEPVHGRLSEIEHCGHSLFESIPSGINSGFKVVRYHSLVIDGASIPKDLVPTAWTVAESESSVLGKYQVVPEQSTESSSNSQLMCPEDSPTSCERGYRKEVFHHLGCDDTDKLTYGGRGTKILMGVSHRSWPHHGVQFHPESVATAYGKQLLLNFRSITVKFWEEQKWRPIVKGKAWNRISFLDKGIFKSLGHRNGRPAERFRVKAKSIFDTSWVNKKTMGLHSKHGQFRLEAETEAMQATTLAKPDVEPNGDKLLRLHFQKLPKLASRTGGSGALFCELFAEEGVGDTFWLDSSSLEQGRARFSFMGGRGGSLWQRITYKITNDNLVGMYGGVLRFQNAAGKVKETVLQGGFLEFLDRELRLRQCRKEDCVSLPFDFCGGFIGYLGYELKGECGAKLSGHKSSMPDAGMFLVDRMVVIDHKYDDIYVLAAFQDGCLSSVSENPENGVGNFLPPNMEFSSCQKVGTIQTTDESKEGRSRLAILGTSYTRNSMVSKEERKTDPEESECERRAAEAWVEKIARKVEILAQQHMHRTTEKVQHLNLVPHLQVTQPDTSSPFVSESSRTGYIRDVERCQELIKDGESYEVCLTTRLRRKVGAVDALGLYLILRETNPAPYSSWLHFGKDGPCICSSSPERFLQLDKQGFLEAKPIKGTAARGDSPLEDERLKFELQNSEKDQAENLMIVDLLRNDLGRVCEPGSVHVPILMSVESYSTVHTMVSTVRGKKRSDVSPVDCVRAAFPGGSMTGAPKLRTMEIIDDLEHSPRGVYSGSIGYFSFNSSFDLNIVIRTIVVHDGEASIGAGGAVVALSDPVAEYDEMLLKTKAPIRAVNMYENAVRVLDTADRRGPTLSLNIQ